MTVWLPEDWRAVGAQGNYHDPQEIVLPPHLGKSGREATKGPQTNAWISNTNASGFVH